MSRGRLDKETDARIEKELPNILDLQTVTLNFQPDFISMGFPAGSVIPIAAVCLQDVTSTLQEVRYALLESLAHIIWYREKLETPNERLAVFFGRFYADDAALRLFTAREHLTEAVICMLELNNQDLEDYRKIVKQRIDKLSLVGEGLRNKMPSHPIANAICGLVDSDVWSKTMKYRNEWVHNKPPIIKGMGIDYERRNRLQISDTHIGISVGGGDEPRYSIDDLLGFIRPALFLLAETVTAIVEYYADFLNKNQKTKW